jgi:hypothetical protein
MSLTLPGERQLVNSQCDKACLGADRRIRCPRAANRHQRMRARIASNPTPFSANAVADDAGELAPALPAGDHPAGRVPGRWSRTVLPFAR